MEIPTKEIIEELQRGLLPRRRVTLANTREAIRVIRAQALEIRELQARICQMRCNWDVTLEHGGE